MGWCRTRFPSWQIFASTSCKFQDKCRCSSRYNSSVFIAHFIALLVLQSLLLRLLWCPEKTSTNQVHSAAFLVDGWAGDRFGSLSFCIWRLRWTICWPFRTLRPVDAAARSACRSLVPTTAKPHGRRNSPPLTWNNHKPFPCIWRKAYDITVIVTVVWGHFTFLRGIFFATIFYFLKLLVVSYFYLKKTVSSYPFSLTSDFGVMLLEESVSLMALIPTFAAKPSSLRRYILSA